MTSVTSAGSVAERAMKKISWRILPHLSHLCGCVSGPANGGVCQADECRSRLFRGSLWFQARHFFIGYLSCKFHVL